MVNKQGNFVVFLVLLYFLLMSPQDAFLAPLPKSTEEMLKKFKLDTTILVNIDRELQVPKDWIDKAKKEGKLKIASTARPREAEVWLAPFRERYKFIDTEYLHKATTAQRVVKTLVSYKAGRILHDVQTGGARAFLAFRQANALADLRSIPAVRNAAEETKDPDGLWVGIQRTYWCMAYNTKLVEKNELPKRWEDLLTHIR